MATPWVLLHRTVNFIAGTGAATAIRGVPSPAEAMAAMKPAMAIAEPPEVTYLSMLRQTRAKNTRGVHGGEISSTDEGLAVLYTGSYRPGNGGFSGPDVTWSTTPPAAPSPRSPRFPLMTRPVCPPSTVSGAPPPSCVTAAAAAAARAPTFSWSSSPRTTAGSPTRNSTCGGRRLRRAPRRPPASGPRGRCASLSLPSCAGPRTSSRSTWRSRSQDHVCAGSTSSPAPSSATCSRRKGCCVDIPIPYNRVGVPEQLRSMGCVRGAINFVCKDDATLRTWALSPDLKEWEETAALRVEDLWASESFRVMELPRVTPTCPVLSAREDGVVYAALIDVEDVDEVVEFGDVAGCFPEVKAHYVLRLDMVRNKVLSFAKSSTDDLGWFRPSLLASELSAYVQRYRAQIKDSAGTC